MLKLTFVDPEGGSLPSVQVSLYDSTRRSLLGSALTDAAGGVTFASLPSVVVVVASHRFAGSANRRLDVAQDGDTSVTVLLNAVIDQPFVALLPVTVAPGSISADRSEISLQVTVVASATAQFVAAQFAERSDGPTPALSLEISQLSDVELFGGECSVWLDRVRTVPDCGTPLREGPYTLSVERFEYDLVGAPPMLAESAPARSAMLLMDQSARVSHLDPSAARTFGARRFIGRAINASLPESLAVAGFAGDGGSALLPTRPLWSPLGAVFSVDRAALEAAVDALEPYVGGSAPAFDAVEEAIAFTASHAPSGGRAVVALLAGGDDAGMSGEARQAALASLRQRRDEAGIQFVVIAGADPAASGERRALAELATALRAPAVSLGPHQSWESGASAALHLAADLITGAPLPALSADVRVSAEEPGAFPPGSTLHGAVLLDTSVCPWHCWTFPVEFTVKIP